jgi:hypothetical protein
MMWEFSKAIPLRLCPLGEHILTSHASWSIFLDSIMKSLVLPNKKLRPLGDVMASNKTADKTKISTIQELPKRFIECLFDAEYDIWLTYLCLSNDDRSLT